MLLRYRILFDTLVRLSRCARSNSGIVAILLGGGPTGTIAGDAAVTVGAGFLTTSTGVSVALRMFFCAILLAFLYALDFRAVNISRGSISTLPLIITFCPRAKLEVFLWYAHQIYLTVPGVPR